VPLLLVDPLVDPLVPLLLVVPLVPLVPLVDPLLVDPLVPLLLVVPLVPPLLDVVAPVDPLLVAGFGGSSSSRSARSFEYTMSSFPTIALQPRTLPITTMKRRSKRMTRDERAGFTLTAPGQSASPLLRLNRSIASKQQREADKCPRRRTSDCNP